MLAHTSCQGYLAKKNGLVGRIRLTARTARPGSFHPKHYGVAPADGNGASLRFGDPTCE